MARGNSIKAHGFNNACAGHHSKKSVYLGDARALAGDASRVKSWTMQDAHKQEFTHDVLHRVKATIAAYSPQIALAPSNTVH